MFALVLAGCAYLPREPFCPGAESYRGMTQMRVAKIPSDLRRVINERPGRTVEAWYQRGSDAVVIVVADGYDHELRYRLSDGKYSLVSDKEVPCIQE
jgi:hypothetical protein